MCERNRNGDDTVSELFEKHRALLDKSIEQFLVSSRFEQRGKLEQLGIEIGTFKEQKQLNIGSSPVPKFLDISIRITRKQIR